jgi:hypothetical protein
VGLLLWLLVAVNLIVADEGLARVGDARAFVEPSDLERTAVEIAGPARIYGVEFNVQQWNAVALRTRLADGLHPLLLQPYVNFMERAGGYAADGYHYQVPQEPGQPNARLLGLINVRVVLSRTPLTDPRFIEVGRVDGTFIYENPTNAGPAYLVAPGQAGALPSIDSLQPLDAVVREIEKSSEEVTYAFTSPISGYLVIGSPTFPGWIALLDGEPATLETVDGILPAVRVGRGEHRLTYRYEPERARQGMALSSAGILIGLIWIMGQPLLRRRFALRSTAGRRENHG